MSYRIINMIVGFDILSATVDSFLGILADITCKSPDAYYSTVLLYAQPGVFGTVIDYEELIEQGIIEDFSLLKTRGMKIGPEMESRNRVGVLILKAKSMSEIVEK